MNWGYSELEIELELNTGKNIGQHVGIRNGIMTIWGNKIYTDDLVCNSMNKYEPSCLWSVKYYFNKIPAHAVGGDWWAILCDHIIQLVGYVDK